MRMVMSHHRRRMKAMAARTITAAQHSMMKYMIDLLEAGPAPLMLSEQQRLCLCACGATGEQKPARF